MSSLQNVALLQKGPENKQRSLLSVQLALFSEADISNPTDVFPPPDSLRTSGGK